MFPSSNLDADYVLFEKALFKTGKVKYPFTSGLVPSLKRYYKCTYAISLFKIKLFNKFKAEPNKYLFVAEIVSDLLSNSSISVLGFYNSSKILTRRLIENFYNHVYYFEHPVEFELLNMGRNEYTPLKDLKLYYNAHPNISSKVEIDKNIKDFNDNIFNHYTELCKHVHTKGADFMNLASNLSEIKPDFDIIAHLDQINKTCSEMIYLIYKFNDELFFSNVEKAIIANLYAAPVKRQLFS